MARLSADNVARARDVVALYPKARSALVPVLHIAQEQDGWLTPEAIAHVAELLDVTPAEVYGTASFYDMLFTRPVGRHLVSICTNIACMLDGAYELLDHAERTLGVKAGGTTTDGELTLEEVECIALCGEAPCLAVNWRFFGGITPERFDALVADLRAGKLDEEVPPHGTLCRVRRAVGLPAAQEAAARSVPEEPEPATPSPPAPAPTAKGDQGEAQPAADAAVATAARETAGYSQSPPRSDTAPTAEGSRPQQPGGG